MFGWMKQKSEVEKNIEEFGFEDASHHYAAIVARKIPNFSVFKQFIAEELDAASQGNEVAKQWVRDSGAKESEYKGALDNSFPEVDGPNGPQQELLRIAIQLQHNQDLMVRFRLKIVEQLMRNMEVSKSNRSDQVATIKTVADIKAIIAERGEEARAIIRDAALAGNTICQIFLSGLGLQIPKEKRTESARKEIEMFTRMAAEGGDAGSQFNMGILCTQKVDTSKEYWSQEDLGLLREALSWHEKAAAQGLSQSLQSIERLKIAIGGQ